MFINLFYFFCYYWWKYVTLCYRYECWWVHEYWNSHKDLVIYCIFVGHSRSQWSSIEYVTESVFMNIQWNLRKNPLALFKLIFFPLISFIFFFWPNSSFCISIEFLNGFEFFYLPWWNQQILICEYEKIYFQLGPPKTVQKKNKCVHIISSMLIFFMSCSQCHFLETISSKLFLFICYLAQYFIDFVIPIRIMGSGYLKKTSYRINLIVSSDMWNENWSRK